MWRVLTKVSDIVREEMDRAGAQELMMPILQPAELWQESGRWDVYGGELIRLKDRHERPCVLAPTHEEVITSLARSEVHSYRKLPVNLYQIQNKYRDERRPRFGLLRGREFIMKDAYSFHASQECLDQEYDVMAEAYKTMFERCGLLTRMVRSDSGAIGGDVSHEFMVLTGAAQGAQQSGENDVFYCDTCDYAANGNRAESILPALDLTGPHTKAEVLDTPNATSIEDLWTRHQFRPEHILKSLLYVADEKTPVMVLIRGDLEVEETKLLNALGALEVRMATDDEVRTWSGGSSKGFIGPVGFPTDIKVLADTSVEAMKNFYVANNQPHKHVVGANWDAEVKRPDSFADLRIAREGDGCPECAKVGRSGTLQVTRGIEVGNIFKLGTKYSSKMNATFADVDGADKPFIMGCYGIGISRVAASAVERFNDANGIVWPKSIAPYHFIIVPANVKDETQMGLAEQIYKEMLALGLEVVLDDRDERAGVKFKDADLIGFPVRVTVGKTAASGQVEIKRRDQKDPQLAPVAEAVAQARALLDAWNPLEWVPPTAS
jgi:prolyl-tRNA synthetase